MLVHNFSTATVPAAFGADARLLSTLEELSEDWKAGRLPVSLSSTYMNAQDVRLLLSLPELRRIQALHGDAPISQISRITKIQCSQAWQAKLLAALGIHFPDPAAKVVGQFWYRPGGFMSWHTNSNDVGLRLYLTYAAEGDKSFFRYLPAGQDAFVTSVDAEGWQARFFYASRRQKLWHCVNSDTHRLSIGVRLTESATDPINDHVSA